MTTFLPLGRWRRGSKPPERWEWLGRELVLSVADLCDRSHLIVVLEEVHVDVQLPQEDCAWVDKDGRQRERATKEQLTFSDGLIATT